VIDVVPTLQFVARDTSLVEQARWMAFAVKGKLVKRQTICREHEMSAFVLSTLERRDCYNTGQEIKISVQNTMTSNVRNVSTRIVNILHSLSH
jgi:hypothetical protein